MVVCCSAINCTTRHKKGENIKFHKFPKDEDLRKRWILAVRRKNFNPSVSAKLCSKHFVEDDYFINIHGNKQMKVGAVPSVFNFAAKNEKKTFGTKIFLEDDEEVENEDQNRASTSVVASNSSETDGSISLVLKYSTLNSNGRQPKKGCTTKSVLYFRKRQTPMKMADFDEEDLKNPMKRHQFWEISQETVKKQQNTIKMLRNKNKNYEKKISHLYTLLEYLKQDNKVTAQGFLILKDLLIAKDHQLDE